MAEHGENTGRARAELLEVADVCDLYHVDRKTVYRWIKAGKLEGKKAGRRWLFTQEAVDAVLEG